jgi:hypothetical protein
MKLLSSLLILMMLVFMSSCSESETLKPCEVNRTGTITVSNSSSNPYNVYVDGVFKIQLAGGTISQKITLNEGNGRQLYAEQVSGYLFYPTTKTTNFNVVRCTDYSWQIP